MIVIPLAARDQARIRFWGYLIEADKRIKHIQILAGVYNLNLDNALVVYAIV